MAGDSIGLFLPYFFFFIACKHWRDQHNWSKEISFENVWFFLELEIQWEGLAGSNLLGLCKEKFLVSQNDSARECRQRGQHGGWDGKRGGVHKTHAWNKGWSPKMLRAWKKWRGSLVAQAHGAYLHVLLHSVPVQPISWPLLYQSCDWALANELLVLIMIYFK